MTRATETHRRELVQALRLHDVPPERIGEIVAEVEPRRRHRRGPA